MLCPSRWFLHSSTDKRGMIHRCLLQAELWPSVASDYWKSSWWHTEHHWARQAPPMNLDLWSNACECETPLPLQPASAEKPTGVLFRVCLLVHDDGSGRYVQGERCGGRSRARISLKTGFMYLSGNLLGQKGLCESRKKFSHPSFLEGLLYKPPPSFLHLHMKLMQIPDGLFVEKKSLKIMAVIKCVEYCLRQFVGVLW